MELRRSDLAEFKNAVVALSKASIPLPIAMRLSKITEFAVNEYKKLEEARDRRIRELGQKRLDDQGQEIFKIDPGTKELDQYVEEMEVALSEVVSIEFEAIPVSDLQGVNLPALDAGILLRFGVIV